MAARTAKQRAALRKAQLASARKRKGRGKGGVRGAVNRAKGPKVRRSAKRAYVAGLAHGHSKTLNRRAGIFKNGQRTNKNGQISGQHRLRKNANKRAGGYVAGVLTTSVALAGAGLAAQHYSGKRARSHVKYGTRR